MNFDIDQLEVWANPLRKALGDLLPDDLESQLEAADPEYIEDARDLMLSLAHSHEVAEQSCNWISATTVIAYHGSRLSEAEQQSIRSQGLRRLDPPVRAGFLERVLSRHPDWEGERHRLPDLISAFGDGRYGRRANQVHLSLSRSNLLRGSNHYLVEGSEFDGHIARQLFGPAGQALLQEGRHPVLLKVALPGAEALDAANRYGRPAPLPNLIREMLGIWAYYLAHREFRPVNGEVDCGVIFYRDLPAEWIVEIEQIDEAELEQFYRPPYPPTDE